MFQFSVHLFAKGKFTNNVTINGGGIAQLAGRLPTEPEVRGLNDSPEKHFCVQKNDLDEGIQSYMTYISHELD